MTEAATPLALSFASWDHDRVMALHDGRVTVPGVRLDSVIETTQKLFPLAVSTAPPPSKLHASRVTLRWLLTSGFR